MKLLLLGLSSLLILLCASCTAPQDMPSKLVIAEINGLVIVNSTASDVTEVKLTIGKLSRQVNVSRVLPMSEFTTEFQAKEYRGRPAQLSWRENGVGYTSNAIVFSLPRERHNDSVLTAYLIIESGGAVRSEAK